MTAADAFRLADAMYGNHIDRCPVCTAPSPDRANAGCKRGRLLEQIWAGRWRARIDALSGRWRR